ncbi:MAG: phosphoribosylformylglycinamidine cyclo-ligase, partial [Treponema sp.]|nr:phosphoribosylformylglycinamidine cyclo-ligase [Treponema sp.]
DMITGKDIAAGDVLIGLSSTGPHSNGYSLIRKLVTNFDDDFGGRKIGEVLLTPTRIYVRPVMDALKTFGKAIHGMVHITGGGFYENIPRMYQKGANLVSVIKKDSWERPAIFDELIRRGANPESVFGTFNMGIGFVLAVDAGKADAIVSHFNENAKKFQSEPYEKAGAAPLKAYKIGSVEKAAGNLGDDLKGSHEATRLV